MKRMLYEYFLYGICELFLERLSMCDEKIGCLCVLKFVLLENWMMIGEFIVFVVFIIVFMEFVSMMFIVGIVNLFSIWDRWV